MISRAPSCRRVRSTTVRFPRRPTWRRRGCDGRRGRRTRRATCSCTRPRTWPGGSRGGAGRVPIPSAASMAACWRFSDALMHLQALAGAPLRLALAARGCFQCPHTLCTSVGTVVRFLLGSFADPGRPTTMSWFSIARGGVGRRASRRARGSRRGRQATVTDGPKLGFVSVAESESVDEFGSASPPVVWWREQRRNDESPRRLRRSRRRCQRSRQNPPPRRGPPLSPASSRRC